MAVVRDPIGRITGMIDQDLLSDEEQPAGRLETLDVERAVVAAELHQVDARQIAGRVVQEHVLRTRIAGVDAARVRAGVPAVDRRVVLHARIAAVPGAFGHPLQQLAGRIVGAGRGGSVTQCVVHVRVLLDRLHELVGDAHRQIGVLEQDRAVGLAVEVRLVAALLNQAVGLLLLLPLALDELQDVRMPDLQRLHLGRATRLAARS